MTSHEIMIVWWWIIAPLLLCLFLRWLEKSDAESAG